MLILRLELKRMLKGRLTRVLLPLALLLSLLMAYLPVTFCYTSYTCLLYTSPSPRDRG